jgi:hypothetical protein
MTYVSLRSPNVSRYYTEVDTSTWPMIEWCRHANRGRVLHRYGTDWKLQHCTCTCTVLLNNCRFHETHSLFPHTPAPATLLTSYMADMSMCTDMPQMFGWCKDHMTRISSMIRSFFGCFSRSICLITTIHLCPPDMWYAHCQRH